MKFYVSFALGVAVGVLITSIKPTQGTLLIDRSNPEKDLYRFDVRGDIDQLHKKKRVVFKVNSHADLSHD